jgi:nucleotide sugar dehydrogenase
MYSISIIGLGFVGNAIHKSLIEKNVKTFVYDKFKNLGSFNDCLQSDIIFLCLPTQYDYNLGSYDKSAIFETCELLSQNNYNGTVVIKSTVEPGTTDELKNKYPTLNFVHNPEFLKAISAVEDFKNQKHIVLGKNCSDELLNVITNFYNTHFPNAEISICSSLESESMKIFCNCFYAVKIQFFTELYLLCQKNNCNFNKVREMMLKNNCINPEYCNIPGPDGNISYGGLCFPKDMNALMKFMELNECPNNLIRSTIEERDIMRNDKFNCN